MPLDSKTVGAATALLESRPDARWLMAYAAALGDELPCYLDTRVRDDRQEAAILAHPLFPVCLEWEPFLATHRLPGQESLTPAERLRGVHATHDLRLHRPLRADEILETRAVVAGVERRRPGAYQLVRLETRDAQGAPVCTTHYGSLYRGVDVAGPDRPCREAPPAPGPLAGQSGGVPRAGIPIQVPALLAHVYSECARIWNPIHTDSAVAAAAGLPGPILHGTATLALAVSRVVEAEAGNDPARVRRIAVRFAAAVPLPSRLVLKIRSRETATEGEEVRFEVLLEDGSVALRDGLVLLSEEAPARSQGPAPT